MDTFPEEDRSKQNTPPEKESLIVRYLEGLPALWQGVLERHNPRNEDITFGVEMTAGA